MMEVGVPILVGMIRGTISWHRCRIPLKETRRAWVMECFPEPVLGWCALLYRGTNKPFPSCPNAVVVRKTTFPASLWAESGLIASSCKKPVISLLSLATRSGWGWRMISSLDVAKETPKSFCSTLGGWALLGFIRRPRAPNMVSKLL